MKQKLLNRSKDRFARFGEERDRIITISRERIKDASHRSVFVGFIIFRLIMGGLLPVIMGLYLIVNLFVHRPGLSFGLLAGQFFMFSIISTAVVILYFIKNTKGLRALYAKIFRNDSIIEGDVNAAYAEAFAFPARITRVEMGLLALLWLVPLLIEARAGLYTTGIDLRDVLIALWIGTVFLVTSTFLFSQIWSERVLTNIYDRGIVISSTDIIKKPGNIYRRIIIVMALIIGTNIFIFSNMIIDLIGQVSADERLRYIFQLAFISAIVLVGSGFYLFVIMKSIKRSFDILVRKMEAVRGGDFSVRVVNFRDDEIGNLYGHFEYMLNGMRNAVENLESEVDKRTERLKVINTRLSKYLSPQLYSKIYTDADKEAVDLSYHRKKLTIFFSDIVNFTPLSESLDPEELSRVLNQYLDEMAKIALKWGGTIDKYIGDAVMIFFGDPEFTNDKDHAARCIRMGLEMLSRLKELREEWFARGITQKLSIRIGINTGFCTVGNFGSENRLDYTVLGRAVNVASRLESAARHDSIFISETTYLLVREIFACEAVGEIKLKGIDQPMKAYTVQRDRYKEVEAAPAEHDLPGFALNLEVDSVPEDSLESVRKALREAYMQVNNRLSKKMGPVGRGIEDTSSQE